MNEKTVPGLAAFDPAIIEAFVQNNLATMKGFERLSQYFFESARKNFDLAIETNKRLAGVRTLTELADLQTKLSQEFFDTVSERSKTASDMGAAILRDTTPQPGTQLSGGTGAPARRTPDARAA